MSYKFVSYTAAKIESNKRSFFNVLEYHNDHERAEREKALLAQAISFAQNNSTKFYTIHDTTPELNGILGLIALSASEVMINDTKKPIVLIDFLFVSNQYRSKTYQHLDDSKISALLIEYAISKFYEIRELLGVSYLVLYPDGGRENQRLIDFYKSMGFDFMTSKKEWMYIKL